MVRGESKVLEGIIELLEDYILYTTALGYHLAEVLCSYRRILLRERPFHIFGLSE